MELALVCQACGHRWTLRDEPRLLVGLACPGCGQAAPAAPSEDLASALEDALSQLWQLGRAVAVHATLRSDALPPDFCCKEPLP